MPRASFSVSVAIFIRQHWINVTMVTLIVFAGVTAAHDSAVTAVANTIPPAFVTLKMLTRMALLRAALLVVVAYGCTAFPAVHKIHHLDANMTSVVAKTDTLSPRVT
jgi:hypothetical protein